MENFWTSEISGLLKAVSDLTGIPVIWKNASGGGEPGLPENQILHCNPFCALIKKRKALVKKCSQNDCIIVKRKSEELKKPFLNECHAGVIEFIVPLFSDEIYNGAVFFGPFKKNSIPCMYKFTEKEYLELPENNTEIENSVARIFSILTQYIIDKKEKFVRKQLEDKIKNKKIQTAIGYINNHFAGPVSVPELAAECGLSISRFIHLFRKECGTNFSEYLAMRRMEEAKKLLSDTNMKIYEIASNCGYSNQCYFGMVFKKITGFSPGDYRKKHRKRLTV